MLTTTEFLNSLQLMNAGMVSAAELRQALSPIARIHAELDRLVAQGQADTPEYWQVLEHLAIFY